MKWSMPLVYAHLRIVDCCRVSAASNVSMRESIITANLIMSTLDNKKSNKIISKYHKWRIINANLIISTLDNKKSNKIISKYHKWRMITKLNLLIYRKENTIFDIKEYRIIKEHRINEYICDC